MIHSKEIRKLAEKAKKEKVYEGGELEYKLDKANPKKVEQVENKATEEKKEKKKAANKGNTDSFKVSIDPYDGENSRMVLTDASGKETDIAYEMTHWVEEIFYKLLKDVKYGIRKIK